MDNTESKRRIDKVRNALANGNVRSIEFYQYGSGACFTYLDPTGDHGCPCTVAQSVGIDEAIQIISGFRFKQHEIPIYNARM